MTGPTETDQQKAWELVKWLRPYVDVVFLQYLQRLIAEDRADVRDAERKRAVRIINESWLNPKKSMQQIAREIEEDR